MPNKELEKVLSAKRESKYIEFKELFDTNSDRDWCEIIKDIIAIANSGGGCILFGVNNDGKPTTQNIDNIFNIDPATITDKIFRYTRVHFENFEMQEVKKRRKKLLLLKIYPINIPIVFAKPGTYRVDNKNQKTAFSQGTIYYRHGAKSEPCVRDDIAKVFERYLNKIRKQWMENISKATKAPLGHSVNVLPAEIVETDDPMATPIRLVDDARAPGYRKIDPDVTHPYRQKELIETLNNLLRDIVVNQHDVQTIKKVHSIDESKPKYFYKPQFGSPQYSRSYINWIMMEYKKDLKFFEKTKANYKMLKKQ